MRITASLVFGTLYLQGCAAPMSIEECSEATVPPFCRAVAQPACVSDDRVLGELRFPDGSRGYCCLEISRECPPREP